jgi:hypothetical protein
LRVAHHLARRQRPAHRAVGRTKRSSQL